MTPREDAAHLVALFMEGARPVLLNGQFYLQGHVTAAARDVAATHGNAIARLLTAFATGRVNRQALAATLAEVPGWRWPGTASTPAAWPGREAFLLGVELMPCTACKRLDGRTCARYGRIPVPQRPVRCLWTLPKARVQ